jgi:hypothetical protein
MKRLWFLLLIACSASDPTIPIHPHDAGAMDVSDQAETGYTCADPGVWCISDYDCCKGICTEQAVCGNPPPLPENFCIPLGYPCQQPGPTFFAQCCSGSCAPNRICQP